MRETLWGLFEAGKKKDTKQFEGQGVNKVKPADGRTSTLEDSGQRAYSFAARHGVVRLSWLAAKSIQ
jgi:hypothetical protein